ncbi:MAG: inositol monophosphatase [Verrucomicrobia bacterium]|nr:inositol monophosphatase [Verrucomicrobiota bacterium]MCG2680978.1 inositol monophosphatase [Kiritimatiellia bacterium]MBU4248148.1 inositol monophosphatase [Verrucomicrobiota bacterium]MBU4290285.1 inositol monophosphatase [Verrucomicrobiota bacterium]MBU4428701.1 inositol monophosphatase [Verrucomicrobiota bacterium]
MPLIDGQQRGKRNPHTIMTPTLIPRLDLEALLDCALNAARAAGRHALDHRRRRREVAQRFAHDVKLILDKECQIKAERVIRRRFPGHGILGEEDDRARAPADIRWIIDPIDGTVNFFHGLPLWCSSVAIQVQGRTVAGAIFAPELDTCYLARTGQPSLCNDKPISVSKTARLQDAVIATGIDKEADGRKRSLKVFQILNKYSQKTRIMGSAALDICHVACGKTDGFFESGVFLWDVAAGALIVEQAGGQSEILTAGPGHQVAFLATNGRIHTALRKLTG